ncbi:MAG: hypothetical protein JHC31_14400 [Sulfurihydrogenibium sp.]|jgi:hypothetical protein|nr:hypothetical protein [Sulfurihydrogenibium sp.]
MIKLTSERDLIQSLIARCLGEDFIKFTINTTKDGNLILEFVSNSNRFTLSKVDGYKDDVFGLRVFDDGRVYIIPAFNKTDVMKTNLLRTIDYFASRLEDFYSIKTHEGAEGTTITFTKRD